MIAADPYWRRAACREAAGTLCRVTEQEAQLDQPIAKTVGLALALVAFSACLFATERGVGGVWFSLLAFGVVARGFGRRTADSHYHQPVLAWVATFTFCLAAIGWGVLLIVSGVARGRSGLGALGVLTVAISTWLTWSWVRVHLGVRRQSPTTD